MTQNENLSHEDLSPVNDDLVTHSKKLFLFFGGIGGAIGMPRFEFYRASRILDHSKIFLRDLSQSWYQRGLPGIGDNAHEVGTYLMRRIKEAGASDVYFVGNSMGGFAALLFCAMLQIGEVIAFSPQTFISLEKRRAHCDDRWPDQIARLHEAGTALDIHDLQPWIQSRFPTMRARIYVSALDILDIQHVQELDNFQNIEVYRFPDGDHGLVTKLRDEGALDRILNP